ncbi:MAG: carboxypeptidase regulatory-like domain-containing protein [Pirellulales bacterium]|nr:carboxypeptidase regulatory-like domain-containing protein [Pirellulales bacterium]
MKLSAILKGAALSLACLGLVLPTPLVQAATVPTDPAANAAGPAKAVIDVGLHKGGVLLGQVVDAQGVPQAKVPVTLLDKDRPLVRTATDASGYFVVAKVPSGTYRVVADQTQGIYRLWAPETAPPAAQQGALLVIGHGPVRAQQGPIAYWLGNPWVIAGLVATAVAVPVAIHNHQIDKKKTPVSP